MTTSDLSSKQKDDVKSLSESPKNITENNLQTYFSTYEENLEHVTNNMCSMCQQRNHVGMVEIQEINATKNDLIFLNLFCCSSSDLPMDGT